MVSTNISFTKERNGYDRAQVDKYIKKLSEAYQTTYYEYLDISGKYKSLLEERENSEKPEAVAFNPDVAAKTLINTEILAQKIIADAQSEASNIITEANKLAIEAAQQSDQARENAEVAIKEANEEAEKMKEAARKTISDANDEAEALATQIKKNIGEAQLKMKQTATEIERLLAYEPRHLEELEVSASAA